MFIEYLIIGLLWCALWETFSIEKEKDNADRVIHILMWPVWLLIFIVGWIQGFLRNFDDRDD